MQNEDYLLKERKMQDQGLEKELGDANKENIKLKTKFDKLVNEELPQAKSSHSIALADNQESLVVQSCEYQVVCSICCVPTTYNIM